MFKWHKVQAAAVFEVVVNGRIEDRMLLYVGSKDQVYFVSFVPLVVEEKMIASCIEGITHEVGVTVKLQFQRDNLSEILKGAGFTTFRTPVRITVQEFVQRQNFLQQIRAAIHTFIQATPFFNLADHDATRNELHQRIANRCQTIGLAGEVVSCNVVPAMPEPALLAQLSAASTGDLGVKKIVEYFQEAMRRLEFLEAEKEEAKVQAQKMIVRARADHKIFEMEENDRVAEAEQASKNKAEERQKADQERNARLKAHNDKLEFHYKTGRLEAEKAIALKELEVAEAREQSEEARRQAKRKEIEIEIERESALSQIRRSELAVLVGELRELPPPNYSGVSTLVLGSQALNAEQPRDLANGLVLGLLGKLTDSIGKEKNF